MTIGILGPTETAAPRESSLAFKLLTELIDSMTIQSFTVLTVNRQVYALSANKGSPTNPYTYGPGGNWDTGTAARPPSIQDANLVLNSSSPPVEIPISILTTDMYAAVPIKLLTNALPVNLYYNDSVPLGQVFLWPIPTSLSNTIALYVPVVSAAFTAYNTAYVCPPGYLRYFRLGLAATCLDPWGVGGEVAQRVRMEADDALIQLKMSNVEMADLSLDPAFTQNRHGTYVIQTDQGA